MKQKILFTGLMAFMFLISVRGWGQTTLNSGDVALIGLDTPGEDFAFVSFVDLDVGTEIYFTDEEADGDYTISTNEGHILFTAPSGGISAGTVVTYAGNSSYFSSAAGSFVLGNSGDGLLAYQGVSVGNVTTFLHAIGEDSGDIGTFPDGFSNYMTFGADDGQYNGTRTGSAVSLMTEINNSANWLTSGSGVIPFNTNIFTVTTGGNIPPSITNIIQNPASGITSSTTVSVSADVADGNGTITAVNLKWGTVSGNYAGGTISMGNGGSGDTYTTATDIPAQADATTVFYVIEATDDEPATTTSAEQSYTVTDPASATLPYTEDFTNDFGDIYSHSVSGTTKFWTYNNSGEYVSMNGYNSGDIEEDWLILPSINLNNTSNEVLSFDSWYNYGTDDANNYLKLVYSTDYPGTGDPTTAAWTDLSYDQPASNQTWTSSGNVDLSAISGTNIHIALKYNYESGSYRLWQIDNILLQEVDVADPNSFAASAQSISQINLTFETNAADDEVIIVYNADGSFTDPSGAAPAVGQAFAGGTVLYKGTSSPQAHTSLTPSETVYYKAWSVDGSNNYSPGLSDNTTTFSNEPTNHATAFSASANSQSAITVSWTDSDASAYLVKASADSYGDIASPTDGVAVDDDVLVKNVAAADPNSVEFTGLTASTTYYFKIFPYNGTDETVNYKTDGSIPEANATTEDAAALPLLIISEVTDPGDDFNGRFVELFNAGNSTIDFSTTTIYFDRQANGDGHSNIQLTGTIGPKETYIIGNSSNINATYGVSADLDFGSVTGNGDDGYFLFFNGDETTGILMDAYGVIDEDGSGKDWEYEDSRAVRNADVTGPNPIWTASEWTITSADVADMTPGEHNNYIYFVGDTDWNTASNWSNNKVPTVIKNLIIPADKPNVEIAPDATADCNNLTLNGSLTVKSDASGTGSLLINGTLDGSGTTNIQRYVSGGQIAGSDPARFKYHLLSIPLDENIEAGDVFTGTYLWHFVPNQTDENSWSGISSLTEELDNQKGFLSYVEGEDNTFSYSGNMNNGNFNVATENISAGNVKLIPNPYPSAIDWETVDLTGTGLNPTIWFFNSETGNYDSYNAGAGDGQQYIPVGQAVFAEAATANPTLTFTNTNRTHEQGTGFYKSGNESLKDILKIAVSANNSADAAFIRFRELADNNYNGFDDASKLRGFAGSPQLYTQSDDEKALSINTLATTQETVIVPLSYELEVAGEALLSFEYLETFEPKVTIFLEDLLLDKMIDLREQNTYTFEHAAENDPLRFNIHFMGVTNVNELASTPEKFTIWASEEQLYIHTNTAFDGDLQIELFDLSGRLLETIKQPTHSPNSISLSDYEGVIMVRVRNNSAVQTQKVFIR